jgi:hypothetical protein
MSEEFFEKLEDNDFKKQLHEKLRQVLETYVFKYNDPEQISAPNIEIANNRLVARVSCPECDGIFTIQTLVRKLNVKWITCNIKRHYKRHYSDSEPQASSATEQKPQFELYSSKKAGKSKPDPEDHYEDVTYVDEDYMEQDLSGYMKVSKEEAQENHEAITLFLNEDPFETETMETTSKETIEKIVEPQPKKRKFDHEEDDEDWLFCRSIWATMKKMNTKTKNKLKIKLLTLTAEMQDDD